MIEDQDKFDLDSFISKVWYIQKQAPLPYLPAKWNWCGTADYTLLKKKTFWNYDI